MPAMRRFDVRPWLEHDPEPEAYRCGSAKLDLEIRLEAGDVVCLP